MFPNNNKNVSSLSDKEARLVYARGARGPKKAPEAVETQKASVDKGVLEKAANDHIKAAEDFLKEIEKEGNVGKSRNEWLSIDPDNPEKDYSAFGRHTADTISTVLQNIADLRTALKENTLSEMDLKISRSQLKNADKFYGRQWAEGDPLKGFASLNMEKVKIPKRTDAVKEGREKADPIAEFMALVDEYNDLVKPKRDAEGRLVIIYPKGVEEGSPDGRAIRERTEKEHERKTKKAARKIAGTLKKYGAEYGIPQVLANMKFQKAKEGENYMIVTKKGKGFETAYIGNRDAEYDLTDDELSRYQI